MLLILTYSLLFLFVKEYHVVCSLLKVFLKHIVTIDYYIFEPKDLRDCHCVQVIFLLSLGKRDHQIFGEKLDLRSIVFLFDNEV